MLRQQFPLRHHRRGAADIDCAVGGDARGDHRRPAHCLALQEGEIARRGDAPVLLEIMGQGGVGGAGGRLLGNAIQRPEIANVRGDWKLRVES